MALDGGADTIQFRDKGSNIRHLLRQARETARVCRERHVPLIVDDRIDLMLAVDANGVHLGQTDLPVSVAREIVSDGRIVGATATTVDQALRAEAEGADYIGFGPVFPTGSKANPASVKGVDGLRDVCTAVGIPVIAIAGVTADHIAAVLDAGAHGVAVMTAVSKADDPTAAARQLRQRIDEYFSI